MNRRDALKALALLPVMPEAMGEMAQKTPVFYPMHTAKVVENCGRMTVEKGDLFWIVLDKGGWRVAEPHEIPKETAHA